MKRPPTECEKRSANHVFDKRLTPKIYIHNLHNSIAKKKKNNPIEKWAQDLNITPNKVYKIANRYMKRYSTSVNNTTMRFHLTSVRMSIIKETNDEH